MEPRTSDLLKKQRLLAAQALQKADALRRSPAKSSIPNNKGFPLSPPTQDRVEFSYESQNGNDSLLPPRRFKSINITELEDDTINLQATPQKVSFEPREIAARSTLHLQRPRKVLDVGQDIKQLLQNSISGEVRELGANDSALHLLECDDRPDDSLPRTADMSILSSARGSITSNPGKWKGQSVKKDFWDMSGAFDNNWMQKELSNLEEISFRSAEAQQTRLFEDEIAWEQENAPIPEMNAKQQPIVLPAPGVKLPKNFKDHVNFSCFSGFLAQEDLEPMQATRLEDTSYCSVGEYFNKMSEDLQGIIPGGSPPRRTPLPLVDLTNVGYPDAETSKNLSSGSKNGAASDQDKENSLHLSGLLKAIQTIKLDDSPGAFVQKLGQARKAKSQLTTASVPDQSDSLKDKKLSATDLQKSQSLKTDMKFTSKTPSFSKISDNANERNQNKQLSDTISVRDSSVFNLSECQATDATQTSVPNSVKKSTQINPNRAYRVSTPNQPLLNTYRVSTGTKLSENQLDLPPIPMIRAPPKCQKQLISNVPPEKPNRKRRSSSATRQELQEAEQKRLELVSAVVQKRSRSPANHEELKAVSNKLVEYKETPKSSIPSLRTRHNKSYLSPEPRSREMQVYNNRSPFNSPKSVISSAEIDHTASIDLQKSPGGQLHPLQSARSTSQCSVASSEYSNRDGMLPLKSTHSEISWGSIRLRRNEKKSLQIKNISSKKLLIKPSITGPGFQLHGTEQSEVITLQSQECRTITVDFCPTVIGAAVGALSFHSPHDCYTQRVVTLYGYGGEASIRVEGIQKGPSGPYLELGRAHNLGRPLERSFSLYNKGSLPAFAHIGIDKKGVDQTILATAVFVQPQKVIIPPNSYAHINVIFKPRRQEVAKILQKKVDVLSITNLHILWGDEPTRYRVRKIIAMVKHNGLQDNKIIPLESVCKKFPNEKEMSELELFSECIFETIHELFMTFREYELVLTVDRALDETMIDLSLCEDSSALFKTMCISSGSASPRLPDDVSPAAGLTLPAKRDSGESWSVKPTFLEFQPNERTKQFVIRSNFYTAQFFELNSNFRPIFKFSPAEGQIRPGQEVIVNVSLHMGHPIQQEIFIMVYIANEKITIPVFVRNKSRPGVGSY